MCTFWNEKAKQTTGLFGIRFPQYTLQFSQSSFQFGVKFFGGWGFFFIYTVDEQISFTSMSLQRKLFYLFLFCLVLWHCVVKRNFLKNIFLFKNIYSLLRGESTKWVKNKSGKSLWNLWIAKVILNSQHTSERF